MLKSYLIFLLLSICCSNLSAQIYDEDAVAFLRTGIKSIKVEAINESENPSKTLYFNLKEFDKEGKLIRYTNSSDVNIGFTYGATVNHKGVNKDGDCELTQLIVKDSLTTTIYEGGNSCFITYSTFEDMDCEEGLFPNEPKKIPIDEEYWKITVIKMNKKHENLMDRRLVYYKRPNETYAKLSSISNWSDKSSELQNFNLYSVNGDCISEDFSGVRNYNGRSIYDGAILEYKYDDKGNWIEERSNKSQKVIRRTFSYY